MNIKHKFTCFLVLFVCFDSSPMPASHVAFKIVPTTLLTAFGAETESQSSISPNSHLMLEGTRVGCEQTALPDSSDVHCLTAMGEPFPFSESELGSYYYFLCLLKELNLSFIRNLIRRFLLIFCQSQAAH